MLIIYELAKVHEGIAIRVWLVHCFALTNQGAPIGQISTSICDHVRHTFATCRWCHAEGAPTKQATHDRSTMFHPRVLSAPHLGITLISRVKLSSWNCEMIISASLGRISNAVTATRTTSQSLRGCLTVKLFNR
jgi:hypothetical protein